MNIMFLIKYLNTAFHMVPVCMSITICTFMVYIGIKTIRSAIRKEYFHIFSLDSVEVLLWVLTLTTILMVTGIIGSEYGVTSPFNGTCHISFKLIDDGITWSGILNVILFIPYGFFSYILFRKLRKNWILGLLFGVCLSVLIEFLQTFIGRFTQLEDILTNVAGTLIGYFLCRVIFPKLVLAKDMFTEMMTVVQLNLKIVLFTIFVRTHSLKLVQKHTKPSRLLCSSMNQPIDTK